MVDVKGSEDIGERYPGRLLAHEGVLVLGEELGTGDRWGCLQGAGSEIVEDKRAREEYIEGEGKWAFG